MDQRGRRRVRLGLVFCLLAAASYGVLQFGLGLRQPTAPTNPAFLVPPYVQLGDVPRESAPEHLEILWQATDVEERWAVEIRETAGAAAWVAAGSPSWKRFMAVGFPSRRLYRATVDGLAPGAFVAYRVLLNGKTVFEAQARARIHKGTPHRFVAFGDGGANTSAQRAIAYETAKAKPDFVLMPGDLAYYKGRLTDYREKFFPIYNCETTSPSLGAPLLRNTLFMVAGGNHDLLESDLTTYPDALAYFFVWSLPLNGPVTRRDQVGAPKLRGPEAGHKAFLELAGNAYPQTANYSFDYGGVHWTVLDTNPYIDWSDPGLRKWLADDLDAAKDADWRFVTFHHPPFQSSKAHADDQRTRVLCSLFEEHGVDIVYNGHVHNYQRTFPLRFVLEKLPDGRAVDGEGHVKGKWTLDTTFDGERKTKPDGVIYIVTGGGGARLYGNDWSDSSYRQSYTAKLVSSIHSMTIVDVTSSKLAFRQIAADGTEIDRFAVTR